MNHSARVAIVLVAFAAILASPAASAARKAKELLQYIPADTPYVIAVTEPLPDELQEKFEPVVDKTLSAYRRLIDHGLEDELKKIEAEEGGAEKAAGIRALLGEITGLMSVEELRAAGFGRDSLFAVYGDGLLPVFRFALTDADAFDATIARIEDQSPEKFAVGSIKGESYRYRDFDVFRLVVATLGKDAVIALVPSTTSEDRLAETLGISKPRNNLWRTKDLRKISKEYGFTDHFIGIIDVQRIVASLTGDPGGRNAELLELAGEKKPVLTDVCRAEIDELAAITPRVVTGYTRVGTDYMDMEMIVEMRDDIAAGLATLPAVVPGLGLDLGGLFSFGLSLDPMALRNFYEARLDAMEADPFECEHLADLQAGTAKGREALAKPLPPVVYSFRGFLANIIDVQGMDLATEKPPESVDAGILFAVENAEALVTMAAMMSPEVAALNLLPDGKARELNLPQLAEIAEQAFAALTEGGLAVSLGADAQERAEALLEADVSDARPFMSVAMDTKRYYELVGDAVMDAKPDEGEEPLSEEMREALRDAMVSSGEIYERMSVNVHFTERGVEVGSRIMLAN